MVANKVDRSREASLHGCYLSVFFSVNKYCGCTQTKKKWVELFIVNENSVPFAVDALDFVDVASTSGVCLRRKKSKD